MKIKNIFGWFLGNLIILWVGNTILSKVAYELLPKHKKNFTLQDWVMFLLSPSWWFK